MMNHELPTPSAEQQRLASLDDELPAVSYIRVAHPDTPANSRAADWQREQIRTVAGRLGIVLADEFADIGYSGLTMERPALRQLLAHVKGGGVGYLIVASWDRLSRDPEHLADLDERLTDALVAVVIAADHLH